MSDFDVTVTLRTQTCAQHHIYAVPCGAIYRSLCPLCAWDRQSEKNLLGDRKDRQIAALRGALTKAKAHRA